MTIFEDGFDNNSAVWRARRSAVASLLRPRLMQASKSAEICCRASILRPISHSQENNVRDVYAGGALPDSYIFPYFENNYFVFGSGFGITSACAPRLTRG